MYLSDSFLKWLDSHMKSRKNGHTGQNPVRSMRDRIEFDGETVRYYLWDTCILHIQGGVYTFDTYHSNLTRDRLNDLACYFDLPLNWVIEEGLLYCNDRLCSWVEYDVRRKTVEYHQCNGIIEKEAK